MKMLGHRIVLQILIVAFVVSACSDSSDDAIGDDPVNSSEVFYKGMDLSFIPELETLDVVFKAEDGIQINDNYNYLSNRGVNLLRTRLWINHENRQYDLSNFITQAHQAQAAGMQVFLDFHFSDTWADPGAQQTPKIWDDLEATDLATAAANYTTEVLNKLQQEGIEPAIIQIGNETNNGILWPVGQIYTGAGENWDNYAQITQAISNSIRIAMPQSDIMIHYAGIDGADYFYQQLVNRNVDFDVIGLSYYPWWHGTDINRIAGEVVALSRKRDQKIMIAETAYPFSLDKADNLNNVVWNQSQLIAGYPATQQGQQEFLETLDNILKSLPDEKGLGYCYWAPDWVAHKNANRGFINGSNWENVALFDFDFKANSALQEYRPSR
jgi:arabinogalactan endo-1,4-beta-galactosidase